MIASQIASIGKSSMDIIISTLEKEPQLLSHHTVGVPAELQRIVSKALCKDREERYQTARDMWIDLKNLREELAFEAKLERGGPPEASPKPVTTGAQAAVAARESGRAARTDERELQAASSSRKRVAVTALIAATLIAALIIIGVIVWLRVNSRPVASVPAALSPGPGPPERVLTY